jgi:hypothetical protein
VFLPDQRRERRIDAGRLDTGRVATGRVAVGRVAARGRLIGVRASRAADAEPQRERRCASRW